MQALSYVQIEVENQSAIDQQKENITKCNRMQVNWLTSICELNKWQIYFNIKQL